MIFIYDAVTVEKIQKCPVHDFDVIQTTVSKYDA